MITALWSGATGMAAQQTLLNTISNNLANVNTTGYKKQRVEFQDLYYREIRTGEDMTASLGHGSRVGSTSRVFMQGNVEAVDNPLFMAIEGEGFFRIDTPKGIAYTRDGSFSINADGRLVTSSGYQVLGRTRIHIPLDTEDISVSPEGIISGVYRGRREELGELNLARFQNPQGLLAAGGNLFLETEASGRPRTGYASGDGFGTILGGHLETSNVDLVSEMINLIVAQRAFEMNSKSVQTADQMWALANNLR